MLLKASLVLLQLILHIHLAQEVVTLSLPYIGFGNSGASAESLMLGFAM